MEFSFDDSLFTSKTRELNGDKLRSYNAKICPALWFTDSPTADESAENRELRLKARADHHYRHEEYGEAREDYHALLGVLAPSRMYMRRDVMESLARCHLKLNSPDAARTLAQEMMDQSTNEDHEVQYLSLLHLVLQSTRNFSEDVSVLHWLVGFHPLHVPYWWGLAHGYEGVQQEAGPGHRFTEGAVRIFSCFLRVKLLLEQSVGLSGSFVQSAHAARLQETLGKLEEFGFTDDQKQTAEQFLSRDLPTDGGYYANPQSEKTTDTLATLVNRDENATFEQRWFSWAEPWILPT